MKILHIDTHAKFHLLDHAVSDRGFTVTSMELFIQRQRFKKYSDSTSSIVLRKAEFY